jgi:hypothetical protein
VVVFEAASAERFFASGAPTVTEGKLLCPDGDGVWADAVVANKLNMIVICHAWFSRMPLFDPRIWTALSGQSNTQDSAHRSPSFFITPLLSSRKPQMLSMTAQRGPFESLRPLTRENPGNYRLNLGII